MMLIRSIWNECVKIILKPRTYLGLGALTLLISVILFALKADGSAFIGLMEPKEPLGVGRSIAIPNPGPELQQGVLLHQD